MTGRINLGELSPELLKELEDYKQHLEQLATTTQEGHVLLSNDIDSISETEVPTMKVISELKQSVVNGKNSVSTAINGKGGNTTGSDAFDILAAAIAAIPTGRQYKTATGTISSGSVNFQTSSSAWRAFNSLTVTDLPFRPTFVIILCNQYINGLSAVTVYISGAYFNQYNSVPTPILITKGTGSNDAVLLSSPAVINEKGFTLPVGGTGAARYYAFS